MEIRGEETFSPKRHPQKSLKPEKNNVNLKLSFFRQNRANLK